MMSMGFIDQIMGAMGMEAAQTVTEEPTSNADPQRTEETKTDEVKEKAEKIQDLDDGTDQGEGASGEEKTYSRDELNDILDEKRKDREGNYLYNAIASSLTGSGFFQHTEAMRGKHLGKKIIFDKLTPELQARIKNYLQ